MARGFYREVVALREEYPQPPIVFLVRQFNEGTANAELLDTSRDDLVALGPDIAVVTGGDLATPSPEAVAAAQAAEQEVTAFYADHPGIFGNLLHNLWVIVALGLLLVVPGLLSARFFGIEGTWEKIALVPGMSIALSVLAGVIVVAVTRAPFGVAHGWATLALATLKEWHPEVLRLFFLSHHYRSPVDYSEDSFLEAKPGLDRFYSTLNAIQEELKKPQSQKKLDSPVMEHCRQAIVSFQTRFEEAMDDDFNTAQALGYFYDLQTYLNTLLSLSKGQPTEEIAFLLKKGLDHLSTKGWVFGLVREDPEKYLARQRKGGLKRLNLTEEEIVQSIEERNLARKEKNYRRADEVRNNLLPKGIVLEDTPTGTNWKLKWYQSNMEYWNGRTLE